MADSEPVCIYCSEAVDVNDPVVVVEHEGERETLLALEPDLAQRGDVLMIHSRCAPTGWRERTQNIR